MRPGALFKFAPIAFAFFLLTCDDSERDETIETFQITIARLQSLDSAGEWQEVQLDQVIDTACTETDGVATCEGQPIEFGTRVKATVEIQALPPEREFDGYVSISAVPGRVVSIESDADTTRTSVLVSSSSITVADVVFEVSFGETRLTAEDVGLNPGPAEGSQCDDGLDNDGDGLFDFPQDPGCFLRNDNSETEGTHSVGTTEFIRFKNPRLHDVQGCSLVPELSNQAITVEGGPGRGMLVVTSVAVNGFYVTDFGHMSGACDWTTGCCDGGRYAHIFAYNYNTPHNLRICDQLRTVGGTVADFFGFTELNFPSWRLLYPSVQRPAVEDLNADNCPIESTQLTSDMITNRPLMETYESALIHVENAVLPSEWVNCDYNDNGEAAYNTTYDEFVPAEEVLSLPNFIPAYCTPIVIDGVEVCSEAECNEVCDQRGCAEITNYRVYGQYPVIVDGVPILVVTNTNIPGFNPQRHSSQTAARIGGVLKEFAPLDTPWIIEPRCPQDLYIEGHETYGESVEIYQRCVPSEETGDYEDPY